MAATTTTTPSTSDLDDPITLRITWDRLVSISEEAAATLVNMAFSSIVREVGDYSCLLMDAAGNSLAQPKTSIPVFIGTLPATVRHFLRKFPAETLKPGDALVTNDPWLGTGQLNDVTIASPIFRNGELVGFSGSVAHMSDIGGTLNMGAAREIYEEGFCIPPSKLVIEGETNAQLMELFLANVRAPDQVQGDVQAMLAANHVGAQGLLSLMDDLGLDRLDELATKIHHLTESAMRKAIAELPDGTYASSVDIGDFEGDIHLEVAVIVEGTDITVDFTGSSPESAYGTNCPMCYTYAYTVYPLKCILEPNLPNNEGCFKPITVTAPLGSIANATRPRACEMRNRIGHMVHAAIFAALADLLPDKVMAHSGSAPVTVDVLSGRRADGTRFVENLCVNGGTGARPGGDGVVAAFPGNMSATPIELIEASAPVLFEAKALIPDSPGAGKYRGGPAQRLVIRNIGDGIVTHSMFYSRMEHVAAGVLGGSNGTKNKIILNGQPLTNPVGRHDLNPGDVIEIDLPSGGGKYPASERSREAILTDLAEGLLTPEGAKAQYGFTG